jgi:DNA mismatch repair protein MutS2
VELEVGGLKVQAKLAELVLLTETPKAKPKASVIPSVQQRPAVEAGAGGVRTQRNTLDLRGQRADEALEETSRFLDRMLQSGEPIGWVLHGHGTGALKKALRNWLPRQKEVERFRPANADEGGDAYTRVELR